MKKLLQFLFTALLLLGSNVLYAQLKINITHFKKLLDESNYGQAYNEAVELRKQPYGKCYQVDYIIGKSLCESNKPDAAQKCFSFIESTYQMSDTVKRFIDLESKTCGKPQDENKSDQLSLLLSFMVNNSNSNSNYAFTRGKISVVKCDAYRYDERGRMVDEDGDPFNKGSVITFDKMRISLSENELSSRLFNPDQKKEAIAFYQNLLGNGYKADTTNRFIIVTNKNSQIKPEDIKKARLKLDSVYTFYTDYFNLKMPDKLITVYLMENKYSLDAIALKVHQLKLPQANIGYSCIGDLSILGNSNAVSLGTMCHELFHLMVRTDIGDIPAWLDEGIASLYETSKFNRNAILKGDINNWRTQIILNYLKGASHVSLNYLISHNWGSFELSSVNNICDVSLNYAYAKHFAIFLQEKSLLKPVLEHFRDRQNVFTDTTSANQSPVDILTSCYGKSMSGIQTDFEEWFDNTYRTKKSTNQTPAGSRSTVTTVYKHSKEEELNKIMEGLYVLRYFNLDSIGKKNLETFTKQGQNYITRYRELHKNDAANAAPVLSIKEEEELNAFNNELTEFIKQSNAFIAAHSEKHQ